MKLRISRTSEFGCSLDALIAYHEHPDTFARLAPLWQRMRIIERSGGIAPGARTIFRGWIGPVPFTWIAEHVEHEGHGFTDVMRRGPLRAWTHVHRFEATPTGSRLTDEITLDVPAPSIARTRIEREVAALLRYRHTVTGDDLMDPGHAPLRIAITGARGLIGSRLSARLRIRGHDVIPLVRRTPAHGEVRWNPEGAWDASPLEGIDAVVHLAGESIGARLRWTDETKRRILESRRQGTASLAEGLAGLRAPPGALVSASAVGIYGDRGDERLTESSPPGDGFLADVCRHWEAAADPARAAGIRVAHPRIGYVIAAKSGAIKPLVWLTLLGAGGPLGGGRHRMAWISLHDVTRALEFLVTEPIEGPVNVTGPDPVPQRGLARALGQLLHRPALLPAPGWAIRLILGELGDELLKSQRAMPERLRAAGFRFRHDALRAALADELGR